MPVSTRRLDDLSEIAALDFLKIDVQGSELSVFNGARRHLERAVAVHTEVCFLPLYKNQPLFGDIDVDLRRRGMIPHSVVDNQQADDPAGLPSGRAEQLTSTRSFSQTSSMSATSPNLS